MKRIIAFVGMMVCVLTVSAQDAVSTIRKHYTETQQMVAQYAEWEKEGDWTMPCPMYYEVNIKQNLPGTGYHKEWIRLYFYEKENYEGQPGEPMLFRNIHFVTAKYNTMSISSTRKATLSSSSPVMRMSTTSRAESTVSISRKANSSRQSSVCVIPPQKSTSRNIQVRRCLRSTNRTTKTI